MLQSPRRGRCSGYTHGRVPGQPITPAVGDPDHRWTNGHHERSTGGPTRGLAATGRRIADWTGKVRWRSSVLSAGMEGPTRAIYTAIIRDITRAQTGREGAERERERLRALFAAMTDVVIVYDTRRAATSVSPQPTRSTLPPARRDAGQDGCVTLPEGNSRLHGRQDP